MDNMDTVTLGLATAHAPVSLMPRPHRHNEIEINFIEQGSMAYLFGGSRQQVQAGHLALFWATIPHQVVVAEEPTHFFWLTIPFATFLQWQLPPALTRPVIRGTFVTNPDATARQADHTLFRQWYADIGQQTPEQSKIVLLEVEARLRRLALAIISNAEDPARQEIFSPDERSKGERMACFLAEHYTESLRIEHVAQVVHLHPNYAVKLFREQYGIGIVDYLTQHRIAHAQRLLVTTEKTVLEIALEAGFGSLSRFYTAFKNMCGQTPVAYRTSLHDSFTQKIK